MANKVPFIGSIFKAFGGAKGNDGKNKKFSADVAEAISRLMMPVFVRRVLDMLPTDLHDKLVKSKESMKDVLMTAAPVIIGGLTNFSELTDDIIADFFEETKREIEKRKNDHAAAANENDARIKLLDILKSLEKEKQGDYINKFNKLLADTPLLDRKRLTAVLSQMSIQQLETLLSLTPEAQKAFLSFAGLSESKMTFEEFVDTMKKIKGLAAKQVKKIDDIFVEGSAQYKSSAKFKNAAKRFERKLKCNKKKKIKKEKRLK